MTAANPVGSSDLWGRRGLRVTREFSPTESEKILAGNRPPRVPLDKVRRGLSGSESDRRHSERRRPHLGIVQEAVDQAGEFVLREFPYPDPKRGLQPGDLVICNAYRTVCTTVGLLRSEEHTSELQSRGL